MAGRSRKQSECVPSISRRNKSTDWRHRHCLFSVPDTGDGLPLARLHRLKLLKEWRQLGNKCWDTKGCSEHFSFKPPYPTTPYLDIYLKKIKIHSDTKIFCNYVRHIYPKLSNPRIKPIFSQRISKKNLF